MKNLLAKSGSKVEVKFSLPPLEILVYKGISEDLVEVEVNFVFFFIELSVATLYFVTFDDDGWTDRNFLYLTLYGIAIKTILHIGLHV